MYVQVCKQPNVAIDVGMLGRYICNTTPMCYQAVNKVLRYLQGTKDHMLTYPPT